MVRVIDRGPGIPAASCRACSSRSTAGNRRRRSRRLRAGPGDRQGVRRGQRRTRVGRVAARAGRRSSSIDFPLAVGTRRGADEVSPPRPPRPRLRRRAADPARAEGRAARGRLRGRARPRPAQEALDAAAVRPPDAAIIDLMLPDGSGVEVCRAAARVERDADPRAVGDRRGGPEGARRWRPAPTTTSPSRSAPRELVARLSAVAAARAATAVDEPAVSVDGLRGRPRGPRRAGATARRSTSRRSSTTCCACCCATAGG